MERSNRVIKFITAAAIVVVAAMPSDNGAMFPHGPKQIDAQRFNLVSPGGKLLATIGQGVNGGFLEFFDTKQNVEMLVGTSGVGAPSMGVAMFDGNAILPGPGHTPVFLPPSPIPRSP